MTKLKDGRQLPAPNYLVGTVAPFKLSTVDLDVPFAFCILAGIFAFVLMLVTFVAAGTKPRKGKIVATILSGVRFQLSFLQFRLKLVSNRCDCPADPILHLCFSCYHYSDGSPKDSDRELHHSIYNSANPARYTYQGISGSKKSNFREARGETTRVSGVPLKETHFQYAKNPEW